MCEARGSRAAALAAQIDHGLCGRYVACALAQAAQFAKAAAALERDDVVVRERAALVEVVGNLLGFVFELFGRRADRESADAAVLIGGEAIRDPLFERGVWLVGAAEIGED